MKISSNKKQSSFRAKEKPEKVRLYRAFGLPGAIRTRGLSLRSYDERLPQRIMASHLFPKTPYVTGILEIALPTQSHAIPWNS